MAENDLDDVMRWLAARGFNSKRSRRCSVSTSPSTMRVIALKPPEDRHERGWAYVQSIEILDLAWDAYMERTVAQEFHPTPHAPRIPQSSQPLDPPGLSMLFDLAITAYVQHQQKRAAPPDFLE